MPNVCRLPGIADPARMLDWLHDYGIASVATSDRGAASLFDADLTGSTMLLAGGEQAGVRPHLVRRARRCVAIPMAGEVASLNVSVAVGICLFESVRQRRERR